MRGYISAIDAVDAIEQPRLSVVTAIELMQGARNRRELAHLESRVRIWGADLIDLKPKDLHRGGRADSRICAFTGAAAGRRIDCRNRNHAQSHFV